MRLSDRVAVVTGGGSGIGRAIARRFAREGAAVVVADLRTETAEAVANEVTRDGGRAVAVHTDVTDPALVEAMARTGTEAFGRVDILVNNAAVFPGDDLLAMTPAEWDRDVAVTLRGPFLCTRAVLPGMLERGSGAIVNIASVNGLGFYGNEAYSAAKAGLINLTKAVAARYGPAGVRANAVAPGTVRTPVWDATLALDPEVFDKAARWYPLGRVGEPEDVANAALYLASDEAAWVTGVVLPVDGGLLSGNFRMTADLIPKTAG